MVSEGLTVTDRVGVIKSDLSDERIMISDLGTARSKEIDYRERRRFAHVVDILFVRHAEHEDLRTVYRFAFIVQSRRNKLHDISRHTGIYLLGKRDEL